MNYTRFISRGLSLLLAIVLLSACQSSKDAGNQQQEMVENAQNITALSRDDGKLPEYLPETFPLPQDAVISTSHSEMSEGKKSVLLIFSTEESMPIVTKLYKEYFEAQNLDDPSFTLDDNNIIIQGDHIEKGESWSVIGGTSASLNGAIELTVTWTEL